MSDGATDPMTAILDQLADCAAQITRLGQRHDADQGKLGGRVDAIAALAATLDAKVTALARHLAGDSEQQEEPGYAPAPVRRWWQLSGADREQAVGVLRGWVEQVYRPGYGQIAELLGPCWDQHPLCLYGIDILAELWSLLYLPAQRTPAILSAQAEYQARILPALADQMTAETTRCHHPPATPAPAPRRTS